MGLSDGKNLSVTYKDFLFFFARSSKGQSGWSKTASVYNIVFTLLRGSQVLAVVIYLDM